MQRIGAAASVISAFHNHSELWIILKQNVDLFKQYIESTATDHVALGVSGYSNLQMIKTHCNRLILNILTAFRAFIDHSETYLKQKYGRNSQIFRDWQKLVSDKATDNLSFAFLSNLRNYVQHCGMPVGHIGFESRLDNETESISYVAEFNFDRDDLLARYRGWQPAVLTALRKRPALFPIQPELETTMQCIAQIALSQMALELPTVKPAVSTLTTLVSEITDPNARPCILTQSLEGDGNPRMTFAHLPLEALSYISRFISDYEMGVLSRAF